MKYLSQKLSKFQLLGIPVPAHALGYHLSLKYVGDHAFLLVEHCLD